MQGETKCKTPLFTGNFPLAYGRDSSKAGEIAVGASQRSMQRHEHFCRNYRRRREDPNGFSLLLRPLVPSIGRSPRRSPSAGSVIDQRCVRTLKGRRSSVLVSAATTLPTPLTQNLKKFCEMRGLSAGGKEEVLHPTWGLRVRCDRRDKTPARVPRVWPSKPLQTSSDFTQREWDAAVNGRLSEQEFVKIATRPMRDPRW